MAIGDSNVGDATETGGAVEFIGMASRLIRSGNTGGPDPQGLQYGAPGKPKPTPRPTPRKPGGPGPQKVE